MSSSPAVSSAARQAAPALSPLKNPSYPARTHFGEMPALAARLKACDDKLAAVRKKAALLTSHAKRAEYEKFVVQMQGARDQIADAVYRMPREAGALYEEDRERLEVAERSFAFLLRRWESVAP